jgi:GNAT superfamily N-acetyltransferase
MPEDESDHDQSSKGAAFVRPPERLSTQHVLAAFENGKHASLDEWLRTRALESEGLSARTYVICPRAASARVVGYHAISAAMEQRIALPNAKLRRGMPEQVPLLLIGRLAVHREFHGMGLGTALLVNAMRRCLAAAEIAGARGIVAHAIDDSAVRFYQRHGFILSPLGERVMLMLMEVARALLE